MAFKWRTGQYATVEENPGKERVGQTGIVSLTSPRQERVYMRFPDGEESYFHAHYVRTATAAERKAFKFQQTAQRASIPATNGIHGTSPAISNYDAFYVCRSCDTKWNKIVPNEDTPSECPNCGGTESPEDTTETTEPCATQRAGDLCDDTDQPPNGIARTYEALHDGLSDMIEGARLKQDAIPDDYRWLVESLTWLARHPPAPQAAPAVPAKHETGLTCPKCGYQEGFSVRHEGWMEVTSDNGAEPDPEDYQNASCGNCGHEWTL